MTTLEPTDRQTRIVLVTAGLSATGGLVGAISAASAVSAIAILSGGVDALTSAGTPGFLGVAAGFGAFCGIIGGPLLGWGLLRRVPLGRAILWTAVGTILGAIGGQVLQPFNPFGASLPGVFAGAFLGFASAGIALRVRSRRTQANFVDAAV